MKSLLVIRRLRIPLGREYVATVRWETKSLEDEVKELRGCCIGRIDLGSQGRETCNHRGRHQR